MPTIRTAAGKGAKLTPTEADTNMKRTPVDKAANYALDATHNREIHELTGTVSTVTLPTVSSSFTETDDWRVTLVNTLATAVTVSRNSQTIDGASSDYTLGPYERVTIWMNSTFDGFWTDNINVSGSFTGTISTSYLTVEQTGTCYYSRNRNSVTVYVPAISGTSNSTSLVVTGLPAILTPTRQQIVVGRVIDNTVNMFGIGVVSGTQVQYYAGASSGSAFTSSGTKGVASHTFSYLLN